MKIARFCIMLLLLLGATLVASEASAQCAMCALNAENSVKNGNTQGNGLNDGIFFLLGAPYLAIAVVGYIWYKKYRKKNVPIDIREEKINLN